MPGKPEFIANEHLKLVTNMGISVTAAGLILTLRYVEAVDVAANREKPPERLNFLLRPHEAVALGTELLRQAQPQSQLAKH